MNNFTVPNCYDLSSFFIVLLLKTTKQSSDFLSESEHKDANIQNLFSFRKS